MRVKTDERRRAIIAAAAQVFHEAGYERASMSQISARLGGSKATLYGYFSSKEQLFAEVMIQEMEAQGESLLGALDDAEGDLETVLRVFAHRYIQIVTSQKAISLIRIALSEGAPAALGSELYALGPRRIWAALEDYLQGPIDRKALVVPSVAVAALHLKGLIEANLFDKIIFNAQFAMPVEQVADLAVDAFLRLYGAKPAGRREPAH